VTSFWLQISGHTSNYYLQYKRKKLLLLPILYICQHVIQEVQNITESSRTHHSSFGQ